MPHDAMRRAEGPTQGTHTGDPHRGDPHRGDPHRGPTQGTHTGDPHRGPTQGTQTGDPHRGEGPTEDPPPEGRATQGTHTGHTQTTSTYWVAPLLVGYCVRVPRRCAKMPLSGLCALQRCGLACCGRHGVQRCAPGAGEKPVVFCRTLVLFSQKRKLQTLCVGRWGPVSL